MLQNKIMFNVREVSNFWEISYFEQFWVYSTIMFEFYEI